MFYLLVSLANQRKRNGKFPKAFIVDSTTVSLNKTRYPWAKFQTTKSGVKLHFRFAYIGNGDTYPDKAVITNASVHDVNRLEIVVDEKLAINIFDRGYLDFERFDELSHDEFFFVSRIKKNTLVRILEEYKVSPGGNDYSGSHGRPRRQKWVSDRSLSLDGSNRYTEEYAANHHQPVRSVSRRNPSDVQFSLGD